MITHSLKKKSALQASQKKVDRLCIVCREINAVHRAKKYCPRCGSKY